MKRFNFFAVALLLGVAASFTACIETVEPAGIQELRAAKAEFLKAKAQYELAMAQWKLADAAYKQAEADAQAEVAKREALYTAYMEASYEADRVKLEQEMKKSEERYKAKMYELQQATAEAQLAYERSIASIELALLTVKDDAIAAELDKLLNTASFTYTKYTLSGTPPVWTPTQETVQGLKNLFTTLSAARNDYADALRAKAELEFAYSPETFKTSLKNQIAVQKGTVEGYEKNLANLKKVAETPLEEFEAKYKEIKDELDALTAKKTELQLKYLQGDEYLAAQQKKKEIDDAQTVIKSELKFAVPEGLQDNGLFNNAVTAMRTYFSTASGYGTASSLYIAINNLWSNHVLRLETGKYYYPSGFSISATLPDQQAVLDYLRNTYIPTVLGSASAIEGLKADYDGYQAQLSAAEAEWLTAYTNYIAAFNAGKYASTSGFDARTVIKDKYDNLTTAVTKAGDDAFAAEQDPAKKADARAAAEAAVKMQFIADYKAYLEVRTKLDGLKLDAAEDITTITDIKVAAQATIMATWEALSEAERFGVTDLSTVPDGEGYAGVFNKIIKDIGYARTLAEVVTYEDWFAAGTTDVARSTATGLTSGGLADKTFKARRKYEDADETNKSHDSWAALDNTLKSLRDAVVAKRNELNEQEIANNIVFERLAETYNAAVASLDVELAGLQAILNAMEDVVENKTGETGYADAIAKIKSDIAGLEGVDDSTTPPTLGTLVGAKIELAKLENWLAAVEAGEYTEAQASAIKEAEAKVQAKLAEVEVLEALYAEANQKKDTLMAMLAESAE